MKIFTIIITTGLLMGHAALAEVTAKSVVHAYTIKAYQLYSQTVDGARNTQVDIKTFLNNPTEENLKTVKNTWMEARKLYSQTEIYRFYGGPIDGDGGPESFINSWPLDEIYIDDIIANVGQFPNLTPEALRELNEKDGEKNVSTGWHAIEYMLWGQDLSFDGPGARPASDYAKTNPLAARRAQYLSSIAAALVSDLEKVQVQWDISKKGSYAQKFLTAEDSLTSMLIGVVKMSGAELSQERMFVALDTRAQEEEHSCFSDTTHFDIMYNYIGVRNVLTGGVIELIRAKDPSVAAEIDEALAATEDAINNMQTPFDQAILNDIGRAGILQIISSLEDLTEAVRQGAVTIGIPLP